ncbi:outer membrane receptor for ferrienterochelin and colicins [Frateuria aurantia DSM 6220]|uniref:Outer membrane receptor for ferrienterochelin and colicins n=1 Tax=Frateuria aurantia (strain ATCC 33424 / DSM 6220 / KCTC 2777 / LMG 1558 / NBRC 3245 / NCIMB 13370) TaxID=767434 RepID=H8L0M3_FRAAD|nr:outer membrane receptor for ferrienterochelin and colicins [Frateuria aurantia DSM 6220]
MQWKIRHPRAWIIHRSAVAAAIIGLLGASSHLFAQSTTGDINGLAPPIQGESARITGLDSGLVRQMPVGTDGRFRFTALPIGRYRIELLTSQGQPESRIINVVAGQAQSVDFNHRSARQLETVTVTSNSVPAIDITSTEARSTFSAAQLNALPVPRDVVDVALLTPGTTAGNAVFGTLPSFGGSSVAENSYYVNGFNVTNLYNSLSFAEVPFQAIDQLDIQTGGYGAQYGFSTGGVTSVNIKRGTNQWKGGISYTGVPNALRENQPTVYRANGSVYRNYSKNTSLSNLYNVWIGGPLIKDKLFLFALGQVANAHSTSYSGGPQTSNESANINSSANSNADKSPYWVLKLDWNITDNHHLEYTGFSNVQTSNQSMFNAGYDDNGTPYKSDYLGQYYSRTGGRTDIFKYTGQLTDDLTLSAQWGRMRSQDSSWTVSPNGVKSTYDGNINSPGSGCPIVAYGEGLSGPQCNIVSTLGRYDGMDTRNAARIDLDWRIGDHELAGGYSDERWNSIAGDAYSGGHYYFYPNDSQVIDTIFNTGGAIKVIQKSWYFEDHWQATDRWLIYAGIRNDSFTNKNGNQQAFVSQDNIWQPRLGFTWDVLGDQSTKLWGTAGRYSLPIAANVALRAATASRYTQDVYSFSGRDPMTGAPLNLGPSQSHTIYNGENGSTPNPGAIASTSLKPYTQDEFILGFAKTLQSGNDFVNNWTLGIKATYRKLRTAIDDTCDSRPMYAAAQANGVAGAWDDEWSVPENMPGCWLFNPGSALSLTTPLDNTSNSYKVTIPGNQLGPKAKRQYEGVVLSAEKTAERYYISASYTWSRSFGNTEGLVKSSNGQDDTGTTADFDFPEVMIGANGYLPNDRRHAIKLYGGFKLSPEWSFGVNLLGQSGAPISCYGGGGGGSTFDTWFGYSGQFHYCNGRISPEGRSGRTPWLWTFSPNVQYKPAWAKGLYFQLTALNLFNNDTPTFVWERAEGIDNSGKVKPTRYYNYKLPKYFNTPRYVRLQVEYDFNL